MVSPSATVLDADKAPCHKKLPEDDASKIPRWVIVPQEPPLAVNVGTFVFDVVPAGEEAAAQV